MVRISRRCSSRHWRRSSAAARQDSARRGSARAVAQPTSAAASRLDRVEQAEPCSERPCAVARTMSPMLISAQHARRRGRDDGASTTAARAPGTSSRPAADHAASTSALFDARGRALPSAPFIVPRWRIRHHAEGDLAGQRRKGDDHDGRRGYYSTDRVARLPRPQARRGASGNPRPGMSMFA